MNTQELEVKFYLKNLLRLEEKLAGLGAHLEAQRVHEVNLRFDTPDGVLKRNLQALRLRRDTINRLTFKGPSLERDGVRARLEIEFSVSDFDAARAFLEALGYQVSFMYEKYRTTYGLDGLQIVLDEMPYGHFAEIEGAEPAVIRRAAGQLGLDWEARILDSYTVIFDRLRTQQGLEFTDLSFANFAGIIPALEQVGLRPAD